MQESVWRNPGPVVSARTPQRIVYFPMESASGTLTLDLGSLVPGPCDIGI